MKRKYHIPAVLQYYSHHFMNIRRYPTILLRPKPRKPPTSYYPTPRAKCRYSNIFLHAHTDTWISWSAFTPTILLPHYIWYKYEWIYIWHRFSFTSHINIFCTLIYFANFCTNEFKRNVPYLLCKGQVYPPVAALTHWGRDKMAAVFQTTPSNAFSWMKLLYFFLLIFHWSLFLMVRLTIFQHWFR